jgi:NDP-sugar pyrophosphorylase family protein
MKACPVVILAGGMATRLRPLTEKIPKSLIEINGEPFIAHQLRLLAKNKMTKVVLCIGFLGEQIEKYVKDGSAFGLEVSYVHDGASLLGTGGAIKKALSRHVLKPGTPGLGDTFFVLYGDSYLVCDYQAIQKKFIASQKKGLMTVFNNQGRWDTCNIEYHQGEIIAYDKKERTNKMHYIDYGLGVLSQQAFDAVPENTFFDLAIVYQTLLKHRQLAAYEVHHRFYEIGSHAGIEELNCFLAQQYPEITEPHLCNLSNNI